MRTVPPTLDINHRGFERVKLDLYLVSRLTVAPVLFSRLTGRPDLEVILKERAEKLKNKKFEDCKDECSID